MKKVAKIALIVVTIAVLATSVYIMVNHLGLVEDLDFGAGAYYYADIPEYEKLSSKANFISKVPMWVHILLFLAWGFLMYKLWCWIEGRGNKK
ncbi:MAG: hypothetical protein HUJ95_02200 [Bacteroidales bacterium]|mgnify:CR=1 FL=1|nr:hypothetical protein [Bacteroidales bacterium]